MTARRVLTGRGASVSVFLLGLTILVVGLVACSSKDEGPRTGNVRLMIQQGEDPDDIDLGDVDTLLVTILDGAGNPVDSTRVIAPPPPPTGGVTVVDIEASMGAGQSVRVLAMGERPVGGADVATSVRGILRRGESAPFDLDVGGMVDLPVTLTPFVPAFQSVQFMDDGARHRIYWNRVPFATRWRLSIHEDGLPARDTLLVDTTFAASQRPVTYQVTALDASFMAGAPGDLLEPGLLLPSVPTNPRLTPRSGERIDVRWNSGGGFVTSWELQRKDEESTFLPLVALSVDTTLFADTTVVDGRRFEYRIRARNSRGVSGWSNSVAAVTSLNAPGDLTLNQADLEVALGWIDRSLSETGYEVERARGNGGFAPLVTLSINASGWVDAPLAENTRYRYRVRSIRGLATSAWAPVVEGTTPLYLPSSPGGLLAQAITPSQINLGWGPARGVVDEYEIERRLPGGAFGHRDTVAGDILVFADLGLPPATTFEYRIRARNATGPGAWSNEASATTLPAPR